MLLGSTAQDIITRADHDEVSNPVSRKPEDVASLISCQDSLDAGYAIESSTGTRVILIIVQIDRGETTECTMVDHIRVSDWQDHPEIR